MFGSKLRRRLLALLAGLALPALSSAQPEAELGLPVLRNYPIRATNGGSQVWTVTQDRRGVLYFGVEKAVLEYDGVTWRRIPMPSSVVRSSAADGAGKIWIGAYANLGSLDPDPNGNLQFVSLLDKIPPKDRNFTDVWQVLITPQGNFFRSNQSLFRWDGKRMQVWSANSRFQALSEVRGRIYTSQEGVGLQEIVGDELRTLPGGAYKNSGKLFLHPYDDRRMLVSARAQTLTLYDGEKVTPFPTEVDDYLKNSVVYTSTWLPDGNFCITTLRGGLVILDHDGRLRRIISTDAGLRTSNVLAAYPDRDGALWLGLGDGIARVEINSPISIFSRDSADDVIRYHGSLYVANAVGANALYRLVADAKAGLSLHPMATSFAQTFSLFEFHDPAGKDSDQLLTATSAGVMKIDGEKVSPAIRGLQGSSESLYTMLQSASVPNRVFIGHISGLSSIRWEGGKWIDEGRLPNFVSGVPTLAEEPDGTLWAATTNRKVLRIRVPSTGMRDSKAQFLTSKDGLVEGEMSVALVAGQIFVIPNPVKSMLRWDGAARRLVADNRFLLPLNDPDASAGLFPLDNGVVSLGRASPAGGLC